MYRIFEYRYGDWREIAQAREPGTAARTFIRLTGGPRTVSADEIADDLEIGAAFEIDGKAGGPRVLVAADDSPCSPRSGLCEPGPLSAPAMSTRDYLALAASTAVANDLDAEAEYAAAIRQARQVVSGEKLMAVSRAAARYANTRTLLAVAAANLRNHDAVNAINA